MKLIQTYSNNCSVDIKNKPVLIEKYFPLAGIDKYITVQTKSGMPAKDYSYFSEVISLIAPILEKENIKIIHLGQDCPPLNNTINLIGQTSVGQAAYILKRSMLHFGADSWMCHFCGAEEIHLVSLYGNTTVANHSPYFFNKDKTIFLESHRNGKKATFAREENPKTVDFIKPEEIAGSICKLLNIEFVHEYKTIIIGEQFNNRSIELIPDQAIGIENLNIPFLIIRGDLLFSEQVIAQQLQVCKCVIFTDRIINPNILNALRGNIQEVVYVMKSSQNPNPDFCKLLFNLKIPFKLISWETDETINNWKLDFLDFGIIFKQKAAIPQDLDINNIEKYYFKTNRLLLSSGKIFPSYWSYLNNFNIPDFNPVFQQIQDIELEKLWIESHNMYFVEKIA